MKRRAAGAQGPSRDARPAANAGPAHAWRIVGLARKEGDIGIIPPLVLLNPEVPINSVTEYTAL